MYCEVLTALALQRLPKFWQHGYHVTGELLRGVPFLDSLWKNSNQVISK